MVQGEEQESILPCRPNLCEASSSLSNLRLCARQTRRLKRDLIRSQTSPLNERRLRECQSSRHRQQGQRPPCENMASACQREFCQPGRRTCRFRYVPLSCQTANSPRPKIGKGADLTPWSLPRDSLNILCSCKELILKKIGRGERI